MIVDYIKIMYGAPNMAYQNSMGRINPMMLMNSMPMMPVMNPNVFMF
jgi:hypothetical protein